MPARCSATDRWVDNAGASLDSRDAHEVHERRWQRRRKSFLRTPSARPPASSPTVRQRLRPGAKVHGGRRSASPSKKERTAPFNGPAAALSRSPRAYRTTRECWPPPTAGCRRLGAVGSRRTMCAARERSGTSRTLLIGYIEDTFDECYSDHFTVAVRTSRRPTAAVPKKTFHIPSPHSSRPMCSPASAWVTKI